ncbi:DNA damage-regulated autophagy modulator protein 1-like [Anomaloglossus baeobatrachus]|uniref:DNA damage-regulated autophagy modulator protein 1-like n=1 Tax=Anomaloglossus baeobatrachus TaxID=238106 RepID=UPI003F4FAF26
MEIQGLAFLPCIWVTWTLLGLCVTYTMTILEGHAPTYILYISETGSYFPESNVFTTVFMLSSILGAATIFFQYRFLDIQSAAIQIHRSPSQKLLLLVGLASCIGTSVVAMFQVEHFPVIHRTGAFISLGFGAVYNVCQSKFLYQMSLSNLYMCHIRMALSLIMAGSLITFFLFKITLIYELCTRRHCKKICDTSAVISEWLSVLTFMLHYLTYCKDFQDLCIKWKWNKCDIITSRNRICIETKLSALQEDI